MDTPQNARNRGRLCTRSQSPHCNVKLICTLRQILNSLYRVLVFELVKELLVQQALAYGMLYLQTSSELPLY